MDILYKNLYNKNLSRSDCKFKIWKSAGLMLTYKCSAKCRFCYYNCSPNQNSPVMSAETVIKSWQGLKNLAGDDAKIHLTGGEAFLYFEHIVEILEKCQKKGLTGIDQIETNASWAVNDKIITERIKILDSLGVDTIKISCDPFHLEFVDIDNIRRLADKSCEILGNKRVLVRWQEYLDNPVDVQKMAEFEKIELFKQSYQKYPFRFTSRASEVLACEFADVPLSTIASQNCFKSFRDAKGVHIDPLGNVFSSVCSGIVIGNINQSPLEDIWLGMDLKNTEFIKILSQQGPAGFINEAVSLGYKPREFYASKCHLCWELREFFFDIGRYNSIIGPVYCYKDNSSNFGAYKK